MKNIESSQNVFGNNFNEMDRNYSDEEYSNNKEYNNAYINSNQNGNFVKDNYNVKNIKSSGSKKHKKC